MSKFAKSRTLWSATDAARVTGGQLIGTFAATGLTRDISSLRKGDLFVAFRAEDIARAAIKGAAAIMLVPALTHALPTDMPALLVQDTNAALEALATANRMRCAMQLVAVRRTEDAAGILTMAAVLLRQQGQTHTAQTGDNVADLAAIHPGTDYAVFSDAICTDVRPDIYIDAENGVVEAAEGQFHFGMRDACDARITNMIVASNGTRIEASVLGEKLEYRLNIAGQKAALQSLATLLMLALVGADLHKAVQDMAAFGLQGYGRQDLIESGEAGNPITLIDETHYSSPASCQAAFKVLALIDPGRGGRRIAILGDMVHMGASAKTAAAKAQAHADLALPLRAANVDLVYTCGALMKNLAEALPANQFAGHADTAAELGEIVPEALVPGDVVLVKGSEDSDMRVVVEALRALPDGRKAMKRPRIQRDQTT